MVGLAFADALDSEKFIACWAALICLIIFALTKPKNDEWIASCQRRTFFYFVGSVFMLLIGFYGSVKLIADWQDIPNFLLWFKIEGFLLYIKFILSLFFKIRYKYKNKLIDDYKESFLRKAQNI